MLNQKLMQEITIHNLAEETEHIETVSGWLWEAWSKASGYTPADVVYRTRHCLHRDRVPQMFIAKHLERPVGVVSLWNNDLPARQDLTPWLAALYIHPDYRRQGVGQKLQQTCINAARALGYRHLYLITDHENYYEKSGWTFLEMAPAKQGRYTRVYQYTLD